MYNRRGEQAWNVPFCLLNYRGIGFVVFLTAVILVAALSAEKLRDIVCALRLERQSPISDGKRKSDTVPESVGRRISADEEARIRRYMKGARVVDPTLPTADELLDEMRGKATANSAGER